MLGVLVLKTCFFLYYKIFSILAFGNVSSMNYSTCSFQMVLSLVLGSFLTCIAWRVASWRLKGNLIPSPELSFGAAVSFLVLFPMNYSLFDFPVLTAKSSQLRETELFVFLLPGSEPGHYWLFLKVWKWLCHIFFVLFFSLSQFLDKRVNLVPITLSWSKLEVNFLFVSASLRIFVICS